MSKTKKIIYSIILIFLLYPYIEKFGFYDNKTVKVDNFIFEKPFLYRNISNETDKKLDEYGTTTVAFLSGIINNIYMHRIKKVHNKEIFEFQFKHYTKLENINFENCYIRYENIKINEEVTIEDIKIYKYPYFISFNKRSDEQVENITNQVCGKSNIININ